MTGRGVAEATVDGDLRPFDGLVAELLHRAAPDTDQVVVVGVTVDVLVAPGALIGTGLPGNAGFNEELYSPKDRRETDPPVAVSGRDEELLRRDVPLAGQELLQDRQAGTGQALTLLAKVVPQDASLILVSRCYPAH